MTRASTQTPITAWKEAGAPKIPAGLSAEENTVYQKLIGVRWSRMMQEQPVLPRNVVVITDLGKDYDDLAAMVVLKELHRLGLIKLLGFVANLHPPQDRASLGRGCLDSLGLEDIPIAWGEEAESNPKKREPPHSYEFPHGNEYFSKIWAKGAVFTPYGKEKEDEDEIESGVVLLDRIIDGISWRKAHSPPDLHQKLTILLLSGLADIATYANRAPERLASNTSDVILQGGYTIEHGSLSYDSMLVPSFKAANNNFDQVAATQFHTYINNYCIESIVFTREAAIAAKLPTQVFTDMKETGHPIGIHLSTIQTTQDREFYKRACNSDPEKRFAPALDQDWFLRTRTIWGETHSPSDPKPDPETDEVSKYTKIICYDALAALGSAGKDVLTALQVLEPLDLFLLSPHPHKIVGQGSKPDINPDNMKVALSALLRGSLLASQQGIPSTHTSKAMWFAGNQVAPPADDELRV